MSLKGHCHFGLREFTEAEKEYSYVLSFYEKPERMHLLYINYAKVINDKQKRKKLLLMACKNDPTPYTWMTCGILHFQVCCSVQTYALLLIMLQVRRNRQQQKL